MTVLLGFFLVLAIGGLGFLGHLAFKLHVKAVRMEADLGSQEARHAQEIKQSNENGTTLKGQIRGLVNKYNEDAKRWHDHAATLKAEVQRLSKWKDAADADIGAAAMLREAHAALEQKCDEDAKRWDDQSEALKAEIQRLSKWKDVADADIRAAAMLREAQAALEQAKADADTLVSTSRKQAAAISADADQKAGVQLAGADETASALVAEAKATAKNVKEEAQALLDSVTVQAAKIIDAAHKKAEEVAGSAYEAMKNAALYERTERAIRNIIDGYGDQYIIPQQSLLDELAEGFSHTQAGQELKRARETTKAMIRNGSAAACEYVEANRKETAIRFVVDAFNGKVDSILSRVKNDNAGKLEQQIRDAITLVNYNGKAFRDARVTEAFLAARLDELKWAAIAQQIAMEEREEQRRAKEIMREEARAVKERDRVLREAAKSEEVLQQGIAQGREQAEHASGKQKAMYEERIREMEEKLKQVQMDKERARSMAEQTKKGYVYIISNVGSFGEDLYKIGLTRRYDPSERVRELSDSSVPFDFDIHALILSEDAPALESQLHKHFMLRQANKANHRREFFRVPLHEIREEIEKLGVTTGVHWTMAADAKQYRESIAIENAIKENPAEREAWIRRQHKLETLATQVAEVGGENGDGEEE